MSEHIIDRLYNVLLERKDADPEGSYVASLYEQGTEKITQKVLEEAAEGIIEAIKGNREQLRAESADLLFHLMVLWADQNIKPEEVFAILERRFGRSGHDEKASRED